MRISLLLISLLHMALPQNTEAQSLDNYQWKNRLLLLVDTRPDTDRLQEQLTELIFDQKALRERDLIIFRVTPGAVYASDGSPSKIRAKKIYDALGIDFAFSGTVLVGKDGGVKLEEPFGVSAQQIFDLIDGMPMRKAEMRKSNKD